MAPGQVLRSTVGDSEFPRGPDGQAGRGVTVFPCAHEGCTWLAGFQPLMPLSVVLLSVEMCQLFQQPRKAPEAVATLQKVTMLALRLSVILAGAPLLALCRLSGFGGLPDGRATLECLLESSAGLLGAPTSPTFPPIVTFLQARWVTPSPPGF